MNKKTKLYKIAIARKVNAVISLICSCLILIHGSYDALWMMLRGKITTLPKFLPLALIIFVVIHIILSIVTAILGSGGKKNPNSKMYKKENIKTMIQRVFGLLIIILLPPHIIGMGNHLVPKVLHSIIHPLFFLVVYAHTAISFSKAFITLGIGNAKFIKIVDRLITILCMFIFIASIIGVYLVMYARWLG
jgi:large-conductance mechanosensitive channel